MRRKKFGGGLTGQSTTSTLWKFDSVSRRNSTAPGSTNALHDWLENTSRRLPFAFGYFYPKPSRHTCPAFERSSTVSGAWRSMIMIPGRERQCIYNRTITAALNHGHIWMRPVTHQWRCMHRNMTVAKPWMNNTNCRQLQQEAKLSLG